MSNTQEIDDRISSSAFEGRFDHHFSTKLGSDQMRKKVREIIKEVVGSVDFAKTIQKYAAEEMDKRLFRSLNYWTVVIATTLITAFLSSIVTTFLKAK